MDLLDVAGELYALAPQAFTAARDARARQAREDGQKDLAQRVRRLPRPTTAAWVVNTLARGDSALLDEMLSLGAGLREAQDAGGEQVRLLSARRRELLAAALGRARALAEEQGHAVSRATADEVEATLRSAVADGAAARAVRSGRLTRALAASGLGDLDVSGAVAAPDLLPPAPVPLRLVPAAAKPPAARPRAERHEPGPARDAAAGAARDALRQAATAADAARQVAADAEADAVARSERLRERVRAARRDLLDLEQQAAASAAQARAAREEHLRAGREARAAARELARSLAVSDGKGEDRPREGEHR